MPRILDAETRQANRDRILHEAAGEFARLGFEQANINVIAERAGIGKGTIYLYFSSKRELFIAMLQSIAERQIEVEWWIQRIRGPSRCGSQLSAQQQGAI